jgi:hypothetical protein
MPAAGAAAAALLTAANNNNIKGMEKLMSKCFNALH